MADFSQPDDQPRGGAPTWMLTYGDSVTLLLTFFVLLLTFSTPNEEDYGLLSRGLLMGTRRMGVDAPAAGQDSLTHEEETPLAGRLDTEGAETPPMQHETPLDEMRQYYKDINLAELRELEEALLIRIPLVELFGTDTELDPAGQKILSHVVKMCRARRYSVVVRARAGDTVRAEDRDARSLLLSLEVVRHLRQNAGEACRDIGVSDNVELSGAAVPEGQCEIIMLEV